MIWGLIGPEGSGKTLAMTYYCLLHIRDGGIVKTFPGYKIETPQGKPLSTDVDFRQLFTDLHSFRNTIICVDEMQNFMDSHLHSSVFARLMGYVGAQRRKANLGIIYTVQDWSWVYNRFRGLTHLITVCRDLHWTNWGRENKIDKGQMISLVTYDMKGFYTGEPYSILSRKTLSAKPIWNWYDSYAAVDIFEGMRKYEIKRDVEVFDIRQNKDVPQSPIITDDVDDNSILNILQDLGAQGVNPSTIAKISKKLK
jgi:hypothetical protein